MPNHVHGVIFFVGAQFIAPEPRPGVQRHASLGEVVRTFKAACTRAIRISGNEGFAWQRGYYEHIVRNDADLKRIHDYIEANPLRWGEDPENPAVGAGPVRDEITGRLRAR
jgi:REP element-mobilizing transposase RayT